MADIPSQFEEKHKNEQQATVESTFKVSLTFARKITISTGFQRESGFVDGIFSWLAAEYIQNLLGYISGCPDLRLRGRSP